MSLTLTPRLNINLLANSFTWFWMPSLRPFWKWETSGAFENTGFHS